MLQELACCLRWFSADWQQHLTGGEAHTASDANEHLNQSHAYVASILARATAAHRWHCWKFCSKRARGCLRWVQRGFDAEHLSSKVSRQRGPLCSVAKRRPVLGQPVLYAAQLRTLLSDTVMHWVPEISVLVEGLCHRISHQAVCKQVGDSPASVQQLL